MKDNRYSIDRNFHSLAGWLKDSEPNQIIVIVGKPMTGKTTLAKRLIEDIHKNTDRLVDLFDGYDGSVEDNAVRLRADMLKARRKGLMAIWVANSDLRTQQTMKEMSYICIECLPGFDFSVTKCRFAEKPSFPNPVGPGWSLGEFNVTGTV